jgi:hypothetical protein
VGFDPLSRDQRVHYINFVFWKLSHYAYEVHLQAPLRDRWARTTTPSVTLVIINFDLAAYERDLSSTTAIYVHAGQWRRLQIRNIIMADSLCTVIFAIVAGATVFCHHQIIILATAKRTSDQFNSAISILPVRIIMMISDPDPETWTVLILKWM